MRHQLGTGGVFDGSLWHVAIAPSSPQSIDTAPFPLSPVKRLKASQKQLILTNFLLHYIDLLYTTDANY